MMDVITGKTRPDAGTVFFGQTIDLTKLTEAEIAHAGIGRKFQKPTVFEQHSVFENLELAMKATSACAPPARAPRRREHDRIAQTLELSTCGERPPRRPAALARPEAVAGDRHAADAGAAPAAARRAGGRHDRRGDERTGELFKSLAGEHSVVVVEHDMDFVAASRSKVTVLHEGSVLAEGSMDAGAERPRG